MMWLSFQISAEEVERRLGLNPTDAQKALLEACANYQVRSRQGEDGLEVRDMDFVHWLRAKQGLPVRSRAKTPAAKWSRIMDQLTRIFPNGVPDRTRYTRKLLKANLIMWDPGLFPIDRAMLGKAIEEYNASRQRAKAAVVPVRRPR